LGIQRTDFSPSQVLLVIMKMPNHDVYCYEDLSYLLDVMHTRLSRPEVGGTDEGHFIQLAMGFGGNYHMVSRADEKYEASPVLSRVEVRLLDIQLVFPGIWRVTALRLFALGCVTKQGSLAELAGVFQAKPAINDTWAPAPENRK
jgi:hypothetical protein